MVTAALPYVYKPRHFGHLAGVYLPADIYTRYCRATGREVLFVCGTDENAATTILEARRRSISPKELSDEQHPLQEEVFRKLGISFDVFSRTSRPIHHGVVWDFYERLDEEGLIYSAEVQQPFCNGCRQYLPDRYVRGNCPKCGAGDQYGDSCEVCAQWYDPSELVDPVCTICGSMPTHGTVRHSFLKLSALQKEVLGYVEKMGRSWRKRTYANTMSWLQDGLRDRDITRDYEWGPKAPFLKPGQVIYNWAENLLGYISATRDWARDNTGENQGKWRPYWMGEGARLVCFVGKDNIFFHTILFPALLLGHRGYNLPSDVVVNEFVNFAESKMSTSRGNVVFLHQLLEELEPDVIRYYAAAIAPENRDTVFSWDDLVQRANADLADNIGNLVNRILALTRKVYGESKVPAKETLGPDHLSLVRKIRRTTKKVETLIESFEFKKALENIVELSRIGNRFLNEKRPWENPEGARATIWSALKLLGTLAVLLYPFLPTTAEKIWSHIGHKKPIAGVGWDAALDSPPDTPVEACLILFRRLTLESMPNRRPS